jgi:hypothetical protein
MSEEEKEEKKERERAGKQKGYNFFPSHPTISEAGFKYYLHIPVCNDVSPSLFRWILISIFFLMTNDKKRNPGRLGISVGRIATTE